MMVMLSRREHQEHLAEIMNAFHDQHPEFGRVVPITEEEKLWYTYECEYHDRLIERVNDEDGYTEEMQ